ncbi:MAG: Uma2 family endonuclease [Planctomycetales bacterium]
MATAFANIAELQDRLGGIPAERIRLNPPPGTATVRDLVRVLDRENRTCELIDGVLVEKTMGYFESIVAMELAYILRRFLATNKLGKVLGEAGTLRILADQVRAADVAFVSWARFPQGRLPKSPVPRLVPDLAVEVLSKGNTRGEMDRKLRDYFDAGVRLVWLIDPPTRSAKSHTAADRFEPIPPNGTIDGGEVLPGFTLSLQELFDNAEATGGECSGRTP